MQDFTTRTKFQNAPMSLPDTETEETTRIWCIMEIQNTDKTITTIGEGTDTLSAAQSALDYLKFLREQQIHHF